MTDERVPYGSPCKPSYQELERRLYEANEKISKCVQQAVKDNEFFMETTTKIGDMLINRCDKVSELRQQLTESYLNLAKIAKSSLSLVSRVKRTTKYAIAACALTAIIAGTSGYYIAKSQLEEKVSNAASAQQQSERR